MILSKLFLVGAFAPLGLAVPLHHVELERRHSYTLGDLEWKRQSRAPAEAKIRVRVALVQRNIEKGDDVLMNVADPDSPSYGRWLSYSDIVQLFEPHQTSVSEVQQWLASEGISHDRHTYSRGRGFVSFDANIGEIENLLRTEYNIFEHMGSGKTHIATDKYHVPQHLTEHIHYITPTVALHPISRRSRLVKRDGSSPRLQDLAIANGVSDDLSDCSSGVTPACIRAMYGIPRGNSSVAGNEIGIFEQGSAWNGHDLDLFLKRFPDTGVPVGTRPITKSIDGGVAPISNNNPNRSEALLDIEVAMPLVYPQKVVDWQVDDPNYSEIGFLDTFFDALDASFCTYRGGDDPTIDPHYPDPQPKGWHHPEMCGTYKPTNVISMSYSWYEYQMSEL